MAQSFREVKECNPSSLNNLGPSSHDIIAAQECSQAESSERKNSFHLSLSLPLFSFHSYLFMKRSVNHLHSLSLTWEEFALLSLCACLMFTVFCSFTCFFFLSQTFISSHIAKASITLLLLLRTTDFNKTLIPNDLYFVAQLVRHE